ESRNPWHRTPLDTDCESRQTSRRRFLVMPQTTSPRIRCRTVTRSSKEQAAIPCAFQFRLSPIIPAVACEDGHPSHHSRGRPLLSPLIFDVPLDVLRRRLTADSRTFAR